MAEMDVDEVNQPVDKFRRKVMVYASVLGIIITLLALIVANYFTRPLHVLVAALRRVGQGETDVRVDIVGEDEVGVLSKSFNSMMEGIREQKELISEKDLENKLLLHNILPEQIAERMIAGEDPIADQIPNVSVIFVTLTGLDDASDSPNAAIAKLNKLIAEFDAAAEEAGVDKIKTIGDDYMAACGLLTPRLDHSKRAVEFSRQLISIAQRLSQEFNRPLELSVGIHSGTVLAGVIGEKKFVYDIWGGTVNIADAIRSHAEPNSILISNNTYENLANQDKYKKAKVISSGGTVELQSWQFIGETNDI
jgi:class 3 adenylate cyclase